MRDWPNEREHLKFDPQGCSAVDCRVLFQSPRLSRGSTRLFDFILKQAAAFRHLMGLLPAASVVRTE